jgi:glycogen operon protein
VAVYLNGEGIPDRDARGDRVVDDSFLLWFSAHDEPIEFRAPGAEYGATWQVVIDTARPDLDDRTAVHAGAVVPVGPRALVVLQRAD